MPGRGAAPPAGVDLAKPAAVSAYLPPLPFASVDPVEDDEILAHQLVSILAGPATAETSEVAAVEPEISPGPAPSAEPDPAPAPAVDPVAEAEAAPEAAPVDEATEVDLAESEPSRQLTPVERAVRGPRVRSL